MTEQRSETKWERSEKETGFNTTDGWDRADFLSTREGYRQANCPKTRPHYVLVTTTIWLLFDYTQFDFERQSNRVQRESNGVESDAES